MDENEIALEIDGQPVITMGRPITAEVVLALAGMTAGTVIRTDGGIASHVVPGQTVDIAAGDTPSFRTFRAGPIRRLRVEGVMWDWGGPAITEDEVRAIAAAAADRAVHVQGSIEPVRRGGVIDLTTTWPPQIDLRAPPAADQTGALVPVTVNGRAVMLDHAEVSFEDLVGLAFPGADLSNPASRALTVTYRRGPPARPEGSLVSRERIQVNKGEVFNVTATSKS